jgi:hypothetical protein
MAAMMGACVSDPGGPVWETVVSKSFSSRAVFEQHWANGYPWGSDHNGSARMFSSNVVVNDGRVTLTAWPVSPAGSQGRSASNPHLPIAYDSGTFYLRNPITINTNHPAWDIRFQCQTPSARGTWPAVWMTGAHGWPPESDFMEFKGSATCWQNTYDGHWQSVGTPVSSPGDTWHTYRMAARLVDATNVDFQYFIDGKMMTEQVSRTFVNAPCWLIVDFQMEGSSGSPGPATPQFFSISNLVVRAEKGAERAGPK